MTIMKKITTAFLAGAILFTGISTSTQANAASLTREEAAILAGAGGFLLGTLVGSGHRRRHAPVVYYEDDWSVHVSRCLARYRSYDPSTDTYIGYDGYERRCRL